MARIKQRTGKQASERENDFKLFRLNDVTVTERKGITVWTTADSAVRYRGDLVVRS